MLLTSRGMILPGDDLLQRQQILGGRSRRLSPQTAGRRDASISAAATVKPAAATRTHRALDQIVRSRAVAATASSSGRVVGPEGEGRVPSDDGHRLEARQPVGDLLDDPSTSIPRSATPVMSWKGSTATRGSP